MTSLGSKGWFMGHLSGNSVILKLGDRRNKDGGV